MTGPNTGYTDWNGLYGVDSPLARQEYNAGMGQIAGMYDQFRQAMAQRSGGLQAAAAVARTPGAQQPPARPDWTDEDLVGAATFWGMPEEAVRAMPRQAVADFVNQKRASARQNQSPIVSGLASLGAMGQMFDVGAQEAIISGIQHLPGIGDWLSRQKIVRDADLKIRQTEESLRAVTPDMMQKPLTEANVGGNLAAMFAPGAAAWAVAGRMTEVMPLVSKAGPIGRAMVQGGLSSYLMAGGTHEGDESPWLHRAEVVGLGAVMGGIAGKLAPAEQALNGRVLHSFMPDPGYPADAIGPMDFNPQVGEPYLASWDESRMGPKPTREAFEAFKSRAVETLSTRLNKVATIVQSPDAPEIAGHTQLGDLSVVQAAASSNPGGHSIIQGISDPAQMANVLGENARFVQSPYRDGLDMIVGDRPLADHAALEYEKFGVFSGQRVHTVEGVAGTVKAVDFGLGAFVEPLNAPGTLMHRAIEDLHPSLESPVAVEVPGLWDAFRQYTGQRAIQTFQSLGVQGLPHPSQLEAIETTSMATWMEDFMDQVGIQRPGDRARVREHFNQSWVQQLRDLAPAETAAQDAAFGDLQSVIETHPLSPVGQLDEHAATKGFLAVPQPGGKWSLLDNVTPDAPSPAVFHFDTHADAHQFLTQFNRDLPDITPIGEFPLEVLNLHPTAPTQMPNTNAAHVDGLSEMLDHLELEGGAPPANVPPVGVLKAGGSVGELNNRIEAAVHALQPTRRVAAAYDEALFQSTGHSWDLASGYDSIGQAQNRMHQALKPFQDEYANLIAPVKKIRRLSGEWAQAYETLDPAEREAFMTSRGWSPAEKASVDQYEQLMVKMFPEAGLDEVRQIPRYFSHIAQRQSVPATFTRAFDDFHFGPTTQQFWEYARTGNLNLREMDPDIVADAYMRSVMWAKHVAPVWDGEVSKWTTIQRDHPELGPAANWMLNYTDMVKGGYHTENDQVVNGMTFALKKLIDPAITKDQTKDFVLSGLNGSYAGLIGYRVNMVSRHFMQMAYALPKAGTDLVRTLGSAVMQPGFLEAARAEAAADGAMSPRVFTSNAPGAFTGEIERVGAGLGGVGPTPVEHTARYEALAKVRNELVDLMPTALKGQSDSILQPMGMFSHAIENFKSIVYVAGKSRATQALQTFREAGPAGSMESLLQDSMMSGFDPAWKRTFQQIVGSGDDAQAAKFAARQLVDQTFFKYGTAESAEIARTVTGKIAWQLGHYELNYAQYLRETLMNGTTADRAKLAGTIAATTAGLEWGSRKSGWNLRYLNPFLALGFGGGPLLGTAVALGSGLNRMVGAVSSNNVADYDAAQRDFSQGAGSSPWNMTPVGGLVRDAQAIGGATQSPTPGTAMLRYGLTGEVGPGPDIERQMLPQTEQMFQRSLQPQMSPVRGGGTLGLPPGMFPQQFITDPPLLQSPQNIPTGILPSTTTLNGGSGVAPGSVEPVSTRPGFPPPTY